MVFRKLFDLLKMESCRYMIAFASNENTHKQSYSNTRSNFMINMLFNEFRDKSTKHWSANLCKD